MSIYREARQWDGSAGDAAEIVTWMREEGQAAGYHGDGRIVIEPPRQLPEQAEAGDWIAQANAGDFRVIPAAEHGRLPGDKPGSSMITVYASIGNSDDKLSQRRWHEYWVAFRRQVLNYADRVHGEWLSIGCAPYQNGCICFDLPELAAASLKAELRKVAGEFGQDSIAWAEAVTEFLGPGRTT